MRAKLKVVRWRSSTLLLDTLANDLELRRKIAEVELELKTFNAFKLRSVDALSRSGDLDGQALGAAANISKIRNTATPGETENAGSELLRTTLSVRPLDAGLERAADWGRIHQWLCALLFPLP